MKKVAAFALVAFTLLPSFAASASCVGNHTQSAASCVPGMVFDEAKGTCVEKPTS
jgi:hypothetical protein